MPDAEGEAKSLALAPADSAFAKENSASMVVTTETYDALHQLVQAGAGLGCSGGGDPRIVAEANLANIPTAARARTGREGVLSPATSQSSNSSVAPAHIEPVPMGVGGTTMILFFLSDAKSSPSRRPSRSVKKTRGRVGGKR